MASKRIETIEMVLESGSKKRKLFFVPRLPCKVQGQKEPKPGSVTQLPEATGQRMQSTLQRLPTKITELLSDQTVGPPVTFSRSFITGGVVLHLDVITTDHWVLEGYCLELQEQLSLQ